MTVAVDAETLQNSSCAHVVFDARLARSKSAVPGGTVRCASTEDSAKSTGAACEVHAVKADGSHVKVLLDSSFAVVDTVAADHGRRDHGPRG